MSEKLLGSYSNDIFEDEENFEVIKCFECKMEPSHEFKMLPCLHLCCKSCLEGIVERSNIAMPQNGTSVKCSIFSCPECSYVVRIVNKDFSFLKNYVINLKKNHSSDVKMFKNNPDIDKNEITLEKNGFNMSNQKDVVNYRCKHIIEDENDANKYFCKNCTIVLCSECCFRQCDEDHDKKNLKDYLIELKTNIEKMNREMLQKNEGILDTLNLIALSKQQLHKNKEDLKKEINTKIKKIIHKIEKEKEAMLTKLESEYESSIEKQNKIQASLECQSKNITDFSTLTKHLLKVDQRENLLNVYSSIETHATRTFRGKPEDHILEHLKVDWMDEGKKDWMVDKLCGTLVKGSVCFGDCRLVKQFNCGLAWPSSMTINSEVFVVAGRYETFETTSKLIFFSVKELKPIHSEQISDCTIIATLSTPFFTHFLVSLSNGDIRKYSFFGDVSLTYHHIFQVPGGLMAHHQHNTFLLSTNHTCISICSYFDLGVISQINLETPSIAHILKNEDTATLIKHPSTSIRSFSAFKDSLCIIFEDNSVAIYSLASDDTNACFVSAVSRLSSSSSSSSSSPQKSVFKCPSHVTSDSFGNFLISDFTDDSLSVCSRGGVVVGKLLSKPALSCPHRLMIGPEDHLYIGQFGGDVLVYHYLSFVRHA